MNRVVMTTGRLKHRVFFVFREPHLYVGLAPEAEQKAFESKESVLGAAFLCLLSAGALCGELIYQVKGSTKGDSRPRQRPAARQRCLNARDGQQKGNGQAERDDTVQVVCKPEAFCAASTLKESAKWLTTTHILLLLFPMPLPLPVDACSRFLSFCWVLLPITTVGEATKALQCTRWA